ncbi:MAG: VWA domain-containing protein [Butyrivibrio sp.]|nr:VWA domain-containing protein [Butyrivibrio sp.]
MIISPIISIALLLVIFAVLLAVTTWGIARTSVKRTEKIFTMLRIGLIYTLVFVIGLRPMVKDESYEFSSRNLDVIFVIDTTVSMWAVDYKGGDHRIEGALADAKAIVEELAGSNFALITFDDQSHVLSPCTQDMEHINTLLETLAPPDVYYAGGSDMSLPYRDLESLLLSSSRKENRKSIVIFMSDGEITNGQKLTSYEKLKDYIDSGAVLGYGSEKGGKMKVDKYTYVYDESEGKDAVSYIDEDNLKSIAKDLEVDYYNMNSGNMGLSQLITVIKAASKTVSDKESGLEKYKDIYYWFAIPLVLLLLAELCIFSRRGRL